MIEPLKIRNRQLVIRFAVVLLIFALLGSTLALLIRKGQAQRQLLTLHTRILTNLALMQSETALLQQQLATFRQALPADLGSQSPELLLYTRLDQIKSQLQPSEMTVTGLETKEGTTSVGFSMKVPASRYNELVNGMGRLQNGFVPLVDFHEFGMAATDGSIAVAGHVILPLAAKGKP